MLVDVHGKPLTLQPKPVRAKYDAASRDEDNQRHWANADALSAVSANSSSVRRTLRTRSRYECTNNSYAKGIVGTLAAYTVGSGPTLCLTYCGPETTDDARKASQIVEAQFKTWAYVRKLPQMLLTMQKALDVDGESFAVFTSGKANMHTPVTLSLRTYEADHFDSFTSGGAWMVDDAGIHIDENGDPTEYAFSASHPGDHLAINFNTEWVGADSVIHLFRKDRPGQLRGVPKTTPALPLFAMLRRFTLATIVAAETAADFAAIIYGDSAGEEADTLEPWARINIERGALLSAPEGSRLAQLKAEHPNATYDEFVRAILREIARCLDVPAVLAIGDASTYNYSSGRLDLQSFQRSMEVDRALTIERDCLDRIFEAWLDEALLIDGFLPPEFVSNVAFYEWAWRWTSPAHVDRKKEADGQAAELANNTTTLSREYARQGLDWENELRQRAREIAVMNELGLSTVKPNEPLSVQPDNGTTDMAQA